ncbi:MAG TPA: glycosyltransferase family 4 protein [Ideonella sp.]|uniref:glycosyltransferase family 4 protein n=1 Tax=Ideonella sp. TaxID=1929293 RepID=UPI002E2EB2AD|nr:glycosyltransferase family 4 protein [Ideonella sp.]HEX5687209.1 glycosyltransferase family 4 protein [Ideonella sp.]
MTVARFSTLNPSAPEPGLLVILIAPNVSEQMGGEAMKALQILRELRRVLPNTLQITHDRNRAEVTQRLDLAGVSFVADTWVSRALWRSVVLRALLDPWFCWKAVRMAERLAVEHARPGQKVVIHQVEPNSPVMPRWLSRRFPNVLGPLNGNIYYPAPFRHRESLSASLRRRLHMPLQWLRRWQPLFKRRAEMILVAGGERTRVSLLAAGIDPDTLVDTVDCGVPQALLERPRLRHEGTNLRFVHFGRLVFHKGTSLAVCSLLHTRLPIELDVIGRGPELTACRALVEELGLQQRVRFLDWYERHADLIASFGAYRGMVLPSLEDANGIVVQEAMALGLPPVCLDWGGPQLLVRDGESGFLVAPDSVQTITHGIAACLDHLAEDPALAERMSLAAREQARAWCWPEVMAQWLALYRKV